MKRKHFIEFHEQGWMPVFFQSAVTEFLQIVLRKFRYYDCCVPIIVEPIKKTNTTNIIDFCSGSGGPISGVNELLLHDYQIDLPIYLSDLFPKKTIGKVFADNIFYIMDSVNVLTYKKQKGLCTLFTSFHHFSPDKATRVLKNAVDNNNPIAIFEFTENTVRRVLQDLLTPLVVLFFMPALKSLKWPRFLFTFIIPIIPLLITWDAIVSDMRTYSVDELMKIACSAENKRYVWDCKKIKSGKRGCNITYLIGYPKIPCGSSTSS